MPAAVTIRQWHVVIAFQPRSTVSGHGDGKFKVTTQIQGDEVRVNGKSRDELQAVIAAIRAKDFPVAVQFVNFRD